MKKPLLATFSLLFSFLMMTSSCSQHDIDTELDNSPTTTPEYGPNFKFYTDSNLFLKSQSQRTSPKSDPFTIQGVTRENDKLFVEVTYSGGCKSHDFEIVWDGVVNLSNPGRVNILIKHHSNQDRCEALVNDVIEIDLKKYFDNLVDSNNTIFGVSNGSSSQEFTSEHATSSKK